jgi:quercetin dioxygenase-like cupin family protein
MMLMDTLERATVYTTADIVDHVAGTHETARIISKTTGSVSIVAVDAGVDMGNKISPFDTLLHILQGNADVTIDRQGHHLTAGQCIILPAHFNSRVVSKRKFKMLLTVIKSGYET